MEFRTLGGSSLRVSTVGLGLMSMSGIYGKGDDAESIGVIHRALELGVNHLDSADMYGWGHNEALLGRALKGRRDGVIVATKFGQVRGEGGKNTVDGSPGYVAQACETSLKRLGLDVIDLYYQHRVDPATPIEDTVGAMKKLVEQGKVRFIGLSEAAPATVRRAHKVHPLAAVQSEYSLLYRAEAEEMRRATRELGISFVAYAPLGRSLLTGSVHAPSDIPDGDRRRDHPRFKDDNLARNAALVRPIEELAAQKGCTPAQVALAWLLAQGDDVVAIPGTKRRARLEQNLGALGVKLSADEVQALARAIPVGAAAGLRYPEPQMKALQL